ncbi:hypothetical protein JCM10213v2_002757 [Rhodosporidiobolus nylandii]
MPFRPSLARLDKRTAIFALFAVLPSVDAKNRKITVANDCDYTIWPALFTSVGPKPDQITGWEAAAGTKVEFEVQESWGGRIWGRTGCDFTQDVPDYQMCDTGGCKGGLEFNIQEEVDHYDASNVDGIRGFNIPYAITNSADCPLANCPYNLLETCPDELQKKNDAGEVVGCLTDCGAFGDNEEYCCSGAHSLPENLSQTTSVDLCQHYGEGSRRQVLPWWKRNCPIAYAYAYDESSGTALFTCTDRVDWTITFCPGPDLYSTTATLPNGSVITQGADYEGKTAAGTATGGSGGESSTVIATGDGGGGGSNGSGSGTGSPAETGSSAKASATGSSSGGSSSGGSSGSSSGSSSATADDDTILGMPPSTAYALLALVVVILIAGIGFFVYSQNKKGGHRRHHRSTSSSDGGSSTDDSGSTTASSDSNDSGGGGGHKHRRKKHNSDSDDDYSLAKIDEMATAEKAAARESVYSAAARSPSGLSGVLLSRRGGPGAELFELPKPTSTTVKAERPRVPRAFSASSIV